MKKVLQRRPSASMVVAVLALVIGASGTAVAGMSKLVSGDSIIKKHSLSGNRLKNHTITRQQLKLSKLGTLPKANVANYATSAGSASTATNATNATTVGGQSPSAFEPAANWFRTGLVTASGGQTVPFQTLGPFTLTLKCTNNGGGSFTAEIDGTSSEANSEFFGTLVAAAGSSDTVLTSTSTTFSENDNNDLDFISGVTHKAYQGGMLDGVNGFGANCFANALMGSS